MIRIRAVSSVLVVAFLAACDRASTPVSPVSSVEVTNSAGVSLTSFLFTKVPPTVATRRIKSPAIGLELVAFRMNASQAQGIVIKEIGFMISGSLKAGDVTRYQLFHYPKGFGAPPVLVGTNDGSGWVPPGGSPASFIRFPLAKPVTLPARTVNAAFALRADIVGGGTYFFVPQVQTMTVNVNGVDMDVGQVGGDLPLGGNTFVVN